MAIGGGNMRAKVMLLGAAWLLPSLALGAPVDPVAQKCLGKIRQGCRAASVAAEGRALPSFEVEAEPAPTESLAEALDAAYRTAPALQAQRYTLRASDEDYAQALAELRPTSALQVTGDFTRTIDGRLTQAANFATNDVVTTKTLTATATVNQPLYTGGKASADRGAALAEVSAGRAQLRGAEGDLLLEVITAYANIRNDGEALRLRAANLRQLTATLDEVRERREAGELTRTDIGLAETQLDLAQSQYNATVQQLEQDRATYAALVGHDAGVLAPPPPLPHVPASIDAAFATAEDLSPDMAQAIATETQSRAKIASVRAEGRPTVTLAGDATLAGQALPYYLHNQDQAYGARAVLTIPITTGGQVRAMVAQAEDRNAADRIGIEGTRRQMVANIVTAWNALATAQRNIAVNERQVAAAKTYDEGTFEEYRAGLRSTFDVLYAHGTLRDAEIALAGAHHDLYVAQATLLRRIGLLEARSLLTGTSLYNPDANFRHAAARAALPWDGAVRGLDTLGGARAVQHGLQQPAVGPNAPAFAADSPVHEMPEAPVPMATSSPGVPVPGTSGVPVGSRP